MPEAATMTPLKRTPFHDIHVALGAKIVPFAGYEMPVQYPRGSPPSTRPCARGAGCSTSRTWASSWITRRPRGRLRQLRHDERRRRARRRPGALLHDPQRPRHDRGRLPRLSLRRPHHDGRERDRTSAKDFAHISQARRQVRRDARGRRATTAALLALQGPKAARDSPAAHRRPISRAIKYYHFAEGEVAGDADDHLAHRLHRRGRLRALHPQRQYAEKLWNALIATGDVTPAGLGARDTLRLEMGMALYGNDIDDTTRRSRRTSPGS